MAIEYKYECYWSQHDGWHFSFGNKRLWQGKEGYRVANLNEDDGYTNHKTFIDLEEALEYMRTT